VPYSSIKEVAPWQKRRKREKIGLDHSETRRDHAARQAMERLFERMIEDIWRRPFPSRLQPERWWPAETCSMIRMSAVDVFEEKDDVVIKAEIPGLCWSFIIQHLQFNI
jgi:HSP20 family molecular chaperone IbpA